MVVFFSENCLFPLQFLLLVKSALALKSIMVRGMAAVPLHDAGLDVLVGDLLVVVVGAAARRVHG